MQNSITTLARRRALAQATATGAPVNPVTHVVFGNGGQNPDGSLIQPETTATRVEGEVGRYPVDAPPMLLPENVETTVRYRTTVPANALEAGTTINTAGLLDSNGVLQAVQVFFPVSVNDGVPLVFEFDDEF